MIGLSDILIRSEALQNHVCLYFLYYKVCTNYSLKQFKSTTRLRISNLFELFVEGESFKIQNFESKFLI